MEPSWSLCPDCGKRCYASRAEAKLAGRQARSRSGVWGHRFRTYLCGTSWHITSWKPAGKVAFYRKAG